MRPFVTGFASELVKLGEKGSHDRARHVAVGAAAASPFAGMVGQERIRHDPTRGAKMRHFKDMDELSRHARPGDVIVTSKHKSLWKTFQAPAFGSEYYHSQPVIGSKGGHGTTASAGELRDESFRAMPRKEVLKHLDTVRRDVGDSGYRDVILMRPRKPLEGEALKKFTQSSLDRTRTHYDASRAVKSYLKDVFVPKIVPASVLNRLGGITKIKYVKGRPVACKGNTCSTLPAQAFAEATGANVVRGKAAKDVMPVDFLRSHLYEPVGRAGKGVARVSRLKPLALRAGMGAGLAGATYAATEKPELAAGVGGAAAGGMAHKALIQYLGKKKGLSAGEIHKAVPSLMRTVSTVLDPETHQGGRVIAKYLAKSLPAKAIGAGVAGLLAHHMLKNRRKPG